MVKLFVNQKLLADLPEDRDVIEGQTVNGLPIRVNVTPIDGSLPIQQIIVTSEELKGRPGRLTEGGVRIIELSRLGTGADILPNGGRLEVKLKNSPIWGRVNIFHGSRERISNPRWRR